MRIILIFGAVLSTMLAAYKWRYKIVNMLLAVSVLRKLGVIITMNIPSIKNKFLSNLFKKSSIG
ncbi:hypothetical protein VBD025_10695 [Virgibacillus flavescens]|uniref:hypothetical protein n=1 Tax=Virgibacillus flavescens TaxID=1611422 RepID=UPI003D32CFA1